MTQDESRWIRVGPLNLISIFLVRNAMLYGQEGGIKWRKRRVMFLQAKECWGSLEVTRYPKTMQSLDFLSLELQKDTFLLCQDTQFVFIRYSTSEKQSTQRTRIPSVAQSTVDLNCAVRVLACGVWDVGCGWRSQMGERESANQLKWASHQQGAQPTLQSYTSTNR